MLKSILAAGLFAGLSTVAAVIPAQAKEWKEIRIATEGAYPPFNFVAADGSLQGMDVEIGKALCAAMQAKCTIVANDWDGMIPALKARKFDAINSSMSKTEERATAIDFSDKMYGNFEALVVRGGSALVALPESLKGKRIGVLQGSTQETYARKHWTTGIEIVPYASQDQVWNDLAAEVDDGHDVEPVHPLPHVVVRLQQRPCALDPDVVVEDVDPAPGLDRLGRSPEHHLAEDPGVARFDEHPAAARGRLADQEPGEGRVGQVEALDQERLARSQADGVVDQDLGERIPSRVGHRRAASVTTVGPAASLRPSRPSFSLRETGRCGLRRRAAPNMIRRPPRDGKPTGRRDGRFATSVRTDGNATTDGTDGHR